MSYCFRRCDRDSPDFKHRKTTSTSTGYCCLSSLISIPDIKSSILVSFNSVYIYIKIYIYIYIIQILCVCVCLSVTYRRQNGWTDHYQILRAYADRSGNGSYLKKIDPTTTQGAFWGFGGGKKVTNLGKIPNRCTDLDQIWHMYADSSGNGCRLKK